MPAGARSVPGRAAGGTGRPAVRVRRLSGGVPPQPHRGPPGPATATGGRRRAVGAGARGPRRRRPRAAAPLRPLVHPPPAAAVPASQRPGRARQRRRRARPWSGRRPAPGAGPCRPAGAVARGLGRGPPRPPRPARRGRRRRRRGCAGRVGAGVHPVTHLLVTNDFPPKVGGIQSYLWELWRRLPPDSFSVLTIDHPDSAVFDASQPFGIERLATRMLLPSPGLASHVRRRCRETGAQAVVLDPALPVGLIGPSLGLPYALVLHGAEVTVPSRLPWARRALARVLRHAVGVIAAGGYPEAQAQRAAGVHMPPVTIVPPGVDR